MDSSFEDYWADFRRLRRGKSSFPDVMSSSTLAPVVTWMRTALHEPHRAPFFVLPGESRDLALRYIQGEVPEALVVRISSGGEPLLQRLHRTVESLRVPPALRDLSRFNWTPPLPSSWDFLGCLLARHSIVIPSVLQNTLERKGSRAIDLYALLVQAQSHLSEMAAWASPSTITDLGAWVEGQPLTRSFVWTGAQEPLTTIEQRLEVLLFLLTLSAHNQVLSETVFHLDGVETFSSEDLNALDLFLRELPYWTICGCPISVLVGWRASSEDKASVRRSHPKLYRRLRMALRWAL